MKKLLSMVLAVSVLVPTFGALPSFAAAEDDTETNYVAVVYDKYGEFVEYNKSFGQALLTACGKDGTVKLLADCDEDGSAIVIGGCSATLDLNGHKIKCDKKKIMSGTNGSVITLGEQAKLTINDTSESKSGTIEGGGAKYGGGIYAPKNNTVIMNAGTITHCTAYYGGGVYVDESSKFIMNGGTINKCYAKYGGGVYVEDKATFETHGGRITNNIAEEDGGGIYVWSAFAKLNDCYIGHNHADEGGGIYSDYNSSKMYSYIMISGSTIEGNTSQSGYGGIYHNDGSLILKDGTYVIDNYTNGKYGGGVYSEKCSIELGGHVEIFGNTANSYEPCDVSFGKSLDSAFKLVGSMSSASFIGVNSKYHKPKAWYSDMHISYYHQCGINEDLPKVDPLKDALFSNNLSTGFVDKFYAEDEDYSETVKQRHYLKITESGDAVNDRIKVTDVIYKNIPLPQSEYSSSYDPARRTIFLNVPEYVKEYGRLDVKTDKEKVIFWRGARLATSVDWGYGVDTRYGLVIRNNNESPSYTVNVENGTVDGEPSAQKKFFDEMRIEPTVPKGMMFSHWEVSGDYTTDYIIGYNQYTKIPLGMLMPNGNVTFKPVFKKKISNVKIEMFSPVVGTRTPFYTKDLDHKCLKATVTYYDEDGEVFRTEQKDVTWQKRQEMFDGTAIHYFDYYADYLASFQIQDTQDGDFCLADIGELKTDMYWNGEPLSKDAYSTRYNYAYGDGYDWRQKNNDNNPIRQRIVYYTRYYTSEKAPIRKSIPSQISVPENTTKQQLTELLPTSVNVQIADIIYGSGKEQPEVKHCQVEWDTSSLPDTVTERLEIKGTYNTAKEGFEVKENENISPTLIVVPKTAAISQMPQITVDGTALDVIGDVAKIAIGKKIKLVTSMQNADIYYKVNGEEYKKYKPNTEIELKGEKDKIVENKIEAYAEANGQTSETLKATIEVDNETKYTVNIVDPNNTEYIYATGAGEYKLGDVVSVDLLQKYMDDPGTPNPEIVHVYDPFKRALSCSARGIVLTDDQKKWNAKDETYVFNFEMPNSNVVIKIETFKDIYTPHKVTILDKDNNKYEYALGAGEYREKVKVTIDSTQFKLKSVNSEGVETTEEEPTKAESVVSQWSAEGITLTDAQKKASKFEFTMPYNDVTIRAEDFRPLVKRVYLSSIIPVAGKPLPDKLEILSATDVNGNEIDKEDIWLEAKIPGESDFGGTWADLTAKVELPPGTIAKVDRTYKTFFGIQSSVSGETAVTLDDYELYMDGDKLSESRVVFVETEAIKDELVSVDWGENRDLFYSMDDAKASLTSEVKVKTKYGTIDTAKVTWDGAENLDSNHDYGDFTITATLTLPNHVVDRKGIGTKKFTIKVRKHIDSVVLKTVPTDKTIRFPARQDDEFPAKSDLEISNQGEDVEAVIENVWVTNKAGNNVVTQKAQAGEEYTITVLIKPNTDYAVLSDNTVFTIKSNDLDEIGNEMKIIGKSANPTSGRSDVYKVSYTFVAQKSNDYPFFVDGSASGRSKNGDKVVVRLLGESLVGFDHWTVEVVYTTTENVYDKMGNVTGTTTVTHRDMINPFKNGGEYDPTARFIVPLLIDDKASLHLTAHYSYGAASYDRDTRTAKIIADKDYKGVKVIFAAYSGDRLVSIKPVSADLKKGENTVTAPSDFDVKDGEKLSIMVWNNLDDITPLLAPFEKTYEKKTEGTGESGTTEGTGESGTTEGAGTGGTTEGAGGTTEGAGGTTEGAGESGTTEGAQSEE